MAKILRLHKQKYLLKEHETEIARCGLKYLNKLIVMEKKRKKNIRKKQGGKPSYPFFLARYRPLPIPLRSTH
jgi:hypothetical protein